jgi:aldehyde:ferredoxin oxidoreductase
MPFGYHGKILQVNLTRATIEVETPPESFYRTYMGGGAMGTYYILREVPQGADPLGTENLLTVFDSVVTGASISGQSRINVNAKSPMSGAIGDSQAGGFFPAEFKFAGYDGIVFRGKSPKWVYLTIINGEAKLNDATHLIGKNDWRSGHAAQAGSWRPQSSGDASWSRSRNWRTFLLHCKHGQPCERKNWDGSCDGK